MRKKILIKIMNIGIFAMTIMLSILFLISFFINIYLTGLFLGIPFIAIGGILLFVKSKLILKEISENTHENDKDTI